MKTKHTNKQRPKVVAVQRMVRPLAGSEGFNLKYNSKPAKPLRLSHVVKDMEDRLAAVERENALLRGAVRKLSKWRDGMVCNNSAALRALGVI